MANGAYRPNFEGTNTVKFEVLVHQDPIEAHKIFLEKTWWRGGLPVPAIPYVTGTYVVQKANDEAGTGGVREVPLFLQERILKAELGKYIEYTVERRVWFPVTSHLGLVSFHQAGPGATRVVWEINFTPKPHAFLMLPFMWVMIDLFLVDYKSFTDKNHSGRGSFLGKLVKLVLFLYVAFMISRLLKVPSGPTYPGTAYLNHLDDIRKATPELTSHVSKHTFLVIGGTGFTGSALVQDLRKRGAKKVKIMGRSLPPVLEFPYGPNKEDRYPLPGVEYIRGDVTDMKALQNAMQGVDVVFHTAVSYGSPMLGTLRGEEISMKVNVGGMKNIYSAAKESKTVKQIIFTSSADTVFTLKPLHRVNETHPYLAYGDSTSQDASGQWEVGDWYAKTKILSEQYLLSMDNKDQIRTVSLRPNGIFGPGENVMVKRAMDAAFPLGGFPFYFASGTKNDFSCLSNLIYAHILASYKLSSDGSRVGGKAYFITDEETSSVADFAIMQPIVEKAAGPAGPYIYIPGWILPPIGYYSEVLEKFLYEKFGIQMPIPLNYKEALKTMVTHYFDNSRARSDLGYKPFTTTGMCQVFVAEEVARRYGMA